MFKGHKMAGRLGGKRQTQVGLTVHEVDVERNLLLIKGAVPGPKNGTSKQRRTRAVAAPKAPVLDVTGKKSSGPHARGVGVRRRAEASLVHETVRAEPNARRAGTHAAKSRGFRRRRPLEAVAAEGNGPRPRARFAPRSSRAAVSRSP